MALAREVSRQVPEAENVHCIKESVLAIRKGVEKAGCRQNLRGLVHWFVDNDLRVVVSDKEGCFVALPNELFNKKAMDAVEKNFKLVNEKASKIKKRALALLEQLNLERLYSGVKSAKGLELQIFFTAKTHKAEVPFRAIVTERNSWQHVVSGFLQKHLEELHVVDPFLVRNSEEVVTLLAERNPSSCKAFSVDVQDLFYSLPHGYLMSCVKNYRRG